MESVASLKDLLQAEQDRGRRREHLVAGETEVLRLIVERAPLQTVLDALARIAERQSSSTLLASILLLDHDGIHLKTGAAPSLPKAYTEAIDGVAIGPNVGSCGTAAYLGQPVVVSDISSDPLWTDFRELAEQHGLRACWSTPILSSRRTVLGTFALYYRVPVRPDPEDEAVVGILTRTAALAIEHYATDAGLAESEERFRSLSRCSPLGIFTTDASGAFTYVNPRFRDICSFEYEKTVEYWLDNNVGSASVKNVIDGWVTAIATRSEFSGEFPVDREGAVRRVSVRAAPMHSSLGEYLGYVGTLEDITDRVLNESKLRSESAIRAAIEESIPSGIAVIDADGRQTYVNRAFAAMVGFTAEELVGQKAPFAYWPPEDISGIEEAFTAIMEGRAPRHGFELRFRRKSGVYFDALVTVSKLDEEAGKRSGWVASVMDIGDRKAVEAELKWSEARLGMALEAGRMGAWEWDIVNGRISWSPQLQAIHGLAPGTFGGTFEDFQADMNPDHRTRVLRTIENALRSKQDYRVEYEIIRPDQSRAWLEARARVFTSADGEPVRMVGICMDITDRKRTDRLADAAT